MRINYNFDQMLSAITLIRSGKVNDGKGKLISELNRFLKQARCVNIVYEYNTDDTFFGSCVIPVGYTLNDLMIKDKYSFNTYIIIIDSKLFDLDAFTDEEVLAIILHEVGHVVDNEVTVKEIQQKMDYTIAKTGVKITSNNISDSENIIKIAIAKSLMFINRLNDSKNKEKFADEFVVRCGYGPQMQSVLDKLVTTSDKYTNNTNIFTKMLVALTTIKNLEDRRDVVVTNLKRYKDMENKKYLQDMYDEAIRVIKANEKANNYLKESSLYEAVYKNSDHNIPLTEASFLKHLKYSSLKYIEDDLYDLALRLNSIGSNVEAASLMRSINMRINLIEEYINEGTEKGSIGSKEVLKLRDVQRRFNDIRDAIIKKGRFDNRYSLYVKPYAIEEI